MIWSVTLNWAAMVVKAGATMEEDTGEIKVNSETVIVAAHFFLDGQFLGFSWSSGPSHVTYTACQNQRRAIVYTLATYQLSPVTRLGRSQRPRLLKL